MRAALPLLLILGGCQLPDRWSMTGGSTVSGGLESAQHGERDFDSQWLELGVSGPLGSAPAPSRLREDCPPSQTASAPTGQPSESEIPWEALALLLGGAGALKGSEYGYRKVKEYRRKE